MFFDLTPEIKLNQKDEIFYIKIRFFIYALSLILIFYFSLTLIFPTQYFTYSFLNPSSTKNTVINPRKNNSEIINRGRVSANEKVYFDAALIGTYSKVLISFNLSNKSENPTYGKIELRKSYQAFFYPEGEPIIYQKSADKYTNGSLVSYGGAVYVLSEGKAYPIDSIETFQSHGYNWDDVIPIDSDELANFEKQKIFTIASPHPSGTLFYTDSGKWYLIKERKKHLLQLENGIFPDRNPIIVSEKSLEISKSCEIQKKKLSRNTFICEIPIDDLQNLIGGDYEFSAIFDNDIKIDNLDLTFKKDFTIANLRYKISEMIRIIKNNYVKQ